MHQIQLVKEKDIEQLAAIFANVFTEADPEKPWDIKHARDYLSYWLKKQPDMFFGAYDKENNPIGATATNIKPWRTGTRCTDGIVFVDSKYQKQGIATALLKKVLVEAMAKYNATTFEAITFAGNEFPLTWYKKIEITPDNHAMVIKGESVKILENLS